MISKIGSSERKHFLFVCYSCKVPPSIPVLLHHDGVYGAKSTARYLQLLVPAVDPLEPPTPSPPPRPVGGPTLGMGSDLSPSISVDSRLRRPQQA